MKTSVTRKKEERGPHHQYEDLDDKEISFKWSKMKRKGKPCKGQYFKAMRKRETSQDIKILLGVVLVALAILFFFFKDGIGVPL